MENIRIRYTWKRYSDGEIWQEVKDIELIECGTRISGLHDANDLIARDLFTGLTDKTDKDIYVGDVLKGALHEKEYVMGFEDGIFDLLNFDQYPHDWPLAFTEDEWEIIGNIHNPITLK